MLAKKEIVSEIEVDNVTVTWFDIISEKFNNYFTNIEPNLDKKIPNTTWRCKTNYMNSMVVYDTNESKKLYIAHDLNLSNSFERDGLSSSIIKATIYETCGPFSTVFNKSLSSENVMMS